MLILFGYSVEKLANLWLFNNFRFLLLTEIGKLWVRDHLALFDRKITKTIGIVRKIFFQLLTIERIETPF